MESFYFVVDSDIHFGLYGDSLSIRPDKLKNVGKIIEVSKTKGVRDVIVAGDITVTNSDGAKMFGIIPISGKNAEIQSYVFQYQIPLEISGINVWENLGNHDNYTWPPFWSLRTPIKNMIETRHGSTKYRFSLRGLNFLSIGLYPDTESLVWIKKQMDTLGSEPVAIVFHYNLTGAWSDWWTEEEKQTFRLFIEPYRNNIKALFCGHRHTSGQSTWEGYNVIMGAGTELALCQWDGKEINVQFI